MENRKSGKQDNRVQVIRQAGNQANSAPFLSRRALSRRLAADGNCSAFETRSLRYGRDDDKHQASLRLALRIGQNQESVISLRSLRLYISSVPLRGKNQC